MTAEWILAQVVAHQVVEAVEPLAHVDGVQRDVDLGGGAEAEHATRPRQGADPRRQIGVGEVPGAFDASAVAQPQGMPALLADDDASLTRAIRGGTCCVWR